MTPAYERYQNVMQELSGDAVLNRLAELATEFEAEHIASTARSIAEKVSEGDSMWRVSVSLNAASPHF